MTKKRSRLFGHGLCIEHEVENVGINDITIENPDIVDEYHFIQSIDKNRDGVTDGGIIEITETKSEISFGDGTNYVRVNAAGIEMNPGIPPAGHTLDSHSNVEIVLIADEQVLAWDSGVSKWKNVTLTSHNRQHALNSGDDHTAVTAAQFNDMISDGDFSVTTHNHNLNDLAEKSHTSLADKGTLTHAQIDGYLDQAVKTTSSPSFVVLSLASPDAATAPMTLSPDSTTKVDLLNADMVDGKHDSFFSASTHNHNLADLSEKSHASLTGILPNQHHNQSHAITSGDHTSTATSGRILKADANGLPVDATNTDVDVADAVTKKHVAATVNAPLVVTTQDIELKNSAGARVTEISIDGTLVDDSDVKLSTQKAIKTYADTKTTLAAVKADADIADAISKKHTRSHTITSTSDHSGGTHKVFYSNGDGDVVELALGADNTFLKSNGADQAPTFGSPAGAVHDRLHDLDSTDDHNTVTKAEFNAMISDGDFISQLEDDASPKLSADLDLNEKKLTSTTNILCDKPLKRTNQGYIFVPRGDAAFDWTAGLTANSNWHDLDLSAIIPATAKAVVIYARIANSSAGGYWLQFRCNGETNPDLLIVTTGVVNYYGTGQGIVRVDANSKIEYYITTGGTSTYAIKVLGWFE